MKISIIAIGNKHDPRFLDAILDYTKRLSHYGKVDWDLIEVKITLVMNSGQIQKMESEKIQSRIEQSDYVILLDERGKNLSSSQLADKIQICMNTSVKKLVFIIGGAYGVDEGLMNRADFTLKLSDMVFPHQLVRLILIEQLYRAHTIIAGEKYHHI